MMKVKFVLYALLLSAMLFNVAADAENVSFDVVMVEASNEEAGTDKRLSGVISALRRTMGQYKSFKYSGGGKGAVDVPGNTSINLGGGYAMEIAAEKVDGNRVTAAVRWKKGKTSLLSTKINAAKGAATIYGNPQGDGKALLVVVTPR